MAPFKLSDVAPRLAKARDQRVEELTWQVWNDKAALYKDRAPVPDHALASYHYTYESRTLDEMIEDMFREIK